MEAIADTLVLVLAKTSRPTRPLPFTTQPQSELLKQQDVDEFEDELSPEQPKFTIAVDNEDDDESSLMAPPRLSMPVEEGEHTAKSIEMPRRALMGDDRGRVSRGSFGSIQTGDKVGTLGDLGMDDPPAGMEDGFEDQQLQEFEDRIGDSSRHAGSGLVNSKIMHLCNANAAQSRYTGSATTHS